MSPKYIFGILFLIALSMLYLSRQLIVASKNGSTLYEQTHNMEQQLSQWKKHRDQNMYHESERFEKALEASKTKEIEQIKLLAESKTKDVQTTSIEIHKVRAEHEEELRRLEIEHRLEQERIEEAMAAKVVSALHHKQAEELSAEQLEQKRAIVDDYRKRSQKILSWYCMLSQSKLDELVNGCQHLQTFGSEAVCIKGDEGLPSAAIPDLTLVPNEVANMGLKHVTVVKFDSPVVSRSIASLARMHIANAKGNGNVKGNDTPTASPNNNYAHLPPSDVYRGATIMMHPWLGFFYRVRVPASGNSGSNEKSGKIGFNSIDQHSYRQECFRRPWAFMSTEDRSRVISPDEENEYQLNNADKTSSSSSSSSLLRSESSKTKNINLAVRSILMLHGQSRIEPILSLIQSVTELSTKQLIDVELIITLCPMSTCLTKSILLKEWNKHNQKKSNTELPKNIIIRLAPIHLRGRHQPKHDLWSTWRTTLADVLTSISAQDNSDVPIVLLDGHTSQLPFQFVQSLSEHLHSKSSGKHAYLPMSTYKSPTHRWKEIYFDTLFATSGLTLEAKNAAQETTEIKENGKTNKNGGYSSRWVMPIAFKLKDGLAAMSAWPEDEESPRASGSGISACGRVTLAWVLQSRLGMTLRRSMVMPAPELHGWDAKTAEHMAASSAKAMRVAAAQQHHEDVKRIKKASDTAPTDTASTDTASMGENAGDGESNTQSNNAILARPPLFFPKNMSPTMVSPETPATSSEFCNLALDALGLCETCGTDVIALMTNDVTAMGNQMLGCSTLLDGSTSKAQGNAVIDSSSHVFRTLNPLHGLSYDTNSDSPLHYEWSLGEADVFV